MAGSQKCSCQGWVGIVLDPNEILTEVQTLPGIYFLMHMRMVHCDSVALILLLMHERYLI